MHTIVGQGCPIEHPPASFDQSPADPKSPIEIRCQGFANIVVGPMQKWPDQGPIVGHIVVGQMPQPVVPPVVAPLGWLEPSQGQRPVVVVPQLEPD